MFGVDGCLVVGFGCCDGLLVAVVYYVFVGEDFW